MQDAGSLAEIFLQQSPACQWIVSTDGAFRRVSTATRWPLFGRTAAELVGRVPGDVLEPDEAAAWRGRFARALSGEMMLLRERRAKGTWYVTVFPLRDRRRDPVRRRQRAGNHAVGRGRTGVAPHRAGRAQGAGVRAHHGVQVPARFGGTEPYRARAATGSDPHGPGKRLAGYLPAHRRNPEAAGRNDGKRAGIQLRAEPLDGGTGRTAAGAGPPGGADSGALSRHAAA